MRRPSLRMLEKLSASERAIRRQENAGGTDPARKRSRPCPSQMPAARMRRLLVTPSSTFATRWSSPAARARRSDAWMES